MFDVFICFCSYKKNTQLGQAKETSLTSFNFSPSYDLKFSRDLKASLIDILLGSEDELVLEDMISLLLVSGSWEWLNLCGQQRQATFLNASPILGTYKWWTPTHHGTHKNKLRPSKIIRFWVKVKVVLRRNGFQETRAPGSSWNCKFICIAVLSVCMRCSLLSLVLR